MMYLICIMDVNHLRNREELLFDLKLVDNLVGSTFGKIDLAFNI